MIPENVTLIVKAPNQQIEDQNVDCQSSWTVIQLKGHLSQVYPSKPTTDEQKIIYSGQLLDDNAVLKDVLRTYESVTNTRHTMHLVCTPKRRFVEPKRSRDTVQPASSEGLRRRTAVPPPETTPATATTTTTNPSQTPTQAPMDNSNVNVNRPETRQNDHNREIEMQNYLSSFANNYGRVPPYPTNYNIGLPNVPAGGDPTSMANHVLMMQQAYMNYMQQYANMWQAGMPATINAAAPTQPQQPLPAQAQPVAPQAAEQQAGEPNDDEDQPHDWLEQLYALSRLAILISFVYVYSSPVRLMCVLLFAAVYYAHSLGLFRDFGVNARIAFNQADPADLPPNLGENAENAEQPTVNAPVTPPDNENSILSVTWMVVTTFFSSLIPELNQ